MRVLIVEDEILIGEAIAQVLKKNNYSVDLALDGSYGLDCGLTNIYDIIILDIMLPELDGIQVLKELRQNGIQTPVILLSAKGDVEDKIRGLDSGADDYLAKPFHTDELLARLRAVTRRKAELIPEGILSFEGVELDTNQLLLRCRDHHTKLTLKEAQLLELFIYRKNTVTSKEIIIEKLWGYNSDANDSHVEVQISFLRKKLKQLPSVVMIDTIRGAGYILKKKDG
ncbi:MULTISPECIES: response regulator transcription factor [Bacillales]|uniref:response regulator transcription factor n=1 Tax=Bacillales TaxID=1385 RepID=UPI0003707380|nr:MULTISPECIES: response regulator transcription factor [Bacillales]KMZ41122.1 transcriptional regulator [Bacillus sp. FJAT-27238]